MQAPQTQSARLLPEATRGLTVTRSDYLFKLLLVGDAGVGKSSLILRFVDDAFTDTYIATIGYDFKLRTINVDEKKVKLQAWEKPGQERFRTIGNYYRGAHAVVILFDVANLESFNNAKRWLEDIDRYACQNVNKLLIGNGCDKATRAVTKQMAEEFAGALGITYVETSAKDGTGVENAFMTVAREIKSRIEFQNLAVQPVRPPSLAERLFSKEKLKKLEEEKTKRKEEQRNGFDDPFDSRDPFDS